MCDDLLGSNSDPNHVRWVAPLDVTSRGTLISPPHEPVDALYLCVKDAIDAGDEALLENLKCMMTSASKEFHLVKNLDLITIKALEDFWNIFEVLFRSLCFFD